MIARCCINFPRCRCACAPVKLDAWVNQFFAPVTPLLATPLMSAPHEYFNVAHREPTEKVVQDEDGEQRPETD